MNGIRLTFAVALTLSLAACGGGSSIGGVASTPPPVPSPTPPPTQPPGFIPTVTPTEFLAATTSSVYPISPTSTEEILADASRVTVGRDAQGNYLITLPVPTGQTNGLSNGFMRKFQFEMANAQTTSDGVVHYRVGQSGSIFPNEKSYLTIIPAGTSRNSLQHVNFAFLGTCLAATCSDGLFPGGEQFPTGSLLAFGNMTPFGEIPVTGSASYLGRFESSGGLVRGGCGDESCIPNYTSGHLRGNLSLDVNFTTGGIAGKLDNITDTTGYFDNAAIDTLRHLPDFKMTGQFNSAGALSGSLSATPGTSFTDGSWNGLFYGPSAVEAGGTLILNSTINSFSGFFGATKQ